MAGFATLMGFKNMQFDKPGMTKAIMKAAEIEVRHAARAWLRAFFVKIPVWTGMARGALKFAKGRSGDAAGQFLGKYLNVSIPIDPIDYRYNKNPEAGGKQSRYTFSNGKGLFKFTFNTDVKHLILNDLYYGSPNGEGGVGVPWGGFEDGESAFFEYLNGEGKQNLIKKVKLTDFTGWNPKPTLDPKLRRDDGGI